MYRKPPILQLSTREMTALPNKDVTTRIVIIVTGLIYAGLKYPLVIFLCFKLYFPLIWSR